VRASAASDSRRFSGVFVFGAGPTRLLEPTVDLAGYKTRVA
jgi:hypothetical protein